MGCGFSRVKAVPIVGNFPNRQCFYVYEHVGESSYNVVLNYPRWFGRGATDLGGAAIMRLVIVLEVAILVRLVH